MILAAGLLVLVGLGLFVAGLATGTTLLYWATVVVCAIAAVLLVLSRRGMTGPAAPAEDTPAPRRSARNREVPAATPAAAGDEPVAGSSSEPSSEPAVVPAVDSAPAAETPAAVPPPTRAAAPVEAGEPPLEEVEVTDLLLVVDLKDDVFVLDEHPRYHLAECSRLAGQDAIPLPLDEARTDGFTPCGICSPDRTMAERERARRAGRKA